MDRSSASEILSWFQWADSLLPTGGYAFSYGLEAAARNGVFTSADKLHEWLSGTILQAVTADIPWIRSCNLLLFQSEPGESGRALFKEYDAWVLLRGARHASLTLGRNLLRLFAALGPCEGEATAAWCKESDVQPHQLLVWALGLRARGVDGVIAEILHVHLILRDQLSAAVRLGLLTPTASTTMHRDLRQEAVPMLERAAAGAEGAYRSGPRLDLFQGRHEYLYTSLFQN